MALAARSVGAMEEVVKAITDDEGEAIAVGTDVTSREQVRESHELERKRISSHFILFLPTVVRTCSPYLCNFGPITRNLVPICILILKKPTHPPHLL